MNKTKLLAYSTPLFLVVTLFFNGLAASGTLNGIPTGDISDKYPVLITPANYVFSIWSLIYLALTAFTVYQFLPKNTNDDSLNQVRIWFIVSSILNSLWLFAWQYEYISLSLIIMILLLLSLISAYQKENIGLTKVNKQRKWLVQYPFSLYLGWISVATIANVSVFLYDIGWNGFGLSDIFWTITVMGVASLLAIFKIYKNQDHIYAAVIVWALIGIAVKNSLLLSIQYSIIAYIAAISFVGLCRWKKAR